MNCENCGTALHGDYCHHCGQSAQPIRKSFLGFLGGLFAEFVGTDSRLLRSFGTLLGRPGRLTQAWIEGHRTRYSSPVQLYLLMAALFFLLNAYHPFVHLDTETRKITSTLTGAAVQRDVSDEDAARLEEEGTSLKVFKERFDARVSAALAPLLIVAVILFSLLTSLLMRRTGHPYAHHAIFTMHWCSFYLLLEAVHRLVGGGKATEAATGAIGILYLIVATRRVYHRWPRAILKGAVLAFGFAIVIGLWMMGVVWASMP